MGLIQLLFGGNKHSDPSKAKSKIERKLITLDAAKKIARAKVGGIQSLLHEENPPVLRNNLYRVFLINRVDRIKYYIEIHAESGNVSTYRETQVAITKIQAQNIALEKVLRTFSRESFRPYVVTVVTSGDIIGVRVRLMDPYERDLLINIHKFSGEPATDVFRLDKPGYRPRPKDKT